MKRLTQKGFNFTTNWVKQQVDSWSIAQCLKKLQKYEDAEEENRLVKLLCKMGGFMYFPDKKYHVVVPVRLNKVSIHFVGLDNASYLYECCSFDNCGDVYEEYEFDSNDIGKTVFLSPEEAEKNLAETSDENIKKLIFDKVINFKTETKKLLKNHFYAMSSETNEFVKLDHIPINYEIEKFTNLLSVEERKFLVYESVVNCGELRIIAENTFNTINSFRVYIKGLSEDELNSWIKDLQFHHSFNCYLEFMLSSDWETDYFNTKEERNNFEF